MKTSTKLRLPRAAGRRKLAAATQLFLYIATCIMAKQTRAISPSSSSSSCERIGFQLCSKMNYNFTRMPNFFADQSQIEADDRSKLYFQLVNSKCSPYIHAYVCELLTPVCSNDPTMRKFEIYPCRSFCHQIKSDCQNEIRESSLKFSLKSDNSDLTFLQAFNCDQLPYEYNGGNGTNAGPCHEVAPSAKYQSSQQQQQQQVEGVQNQPTSGDTNPNTPYWPYDPSLAQTPYITDTSRIDSSLIRPTLPNSFGEPPEAPARQPPRHFNSEPDRDSTRQQQQSNLLSQARAAGQSVVWALIKYSNVLSIATVIILLIALNSKRLTRFKNYLSLSSAGSSSKSSSASSSAGSSSAANQRLFNGPLIAGYPPISSCSVGPQISPTSSARSLMLYAGSGKQPACHKLLPAAVQANESTSTASSMPKLFEDLDSRKTRINLNNANHLNRTLLREQTGNRYLLAGQSSGCSSISGGGAGSPARSAAKHYLHNTSDKQQLFNTLDSQASNSNNQYDYIDYSEPTTNKQRSTISSNRHQQQQLYSNIRLSSPNHQVLLFPNGVAMPFRQ